MIQSRCLFYACSMLLAANLGFGRPPALYARDSEQSPPGRDALQIVVLDGEGAINIIQQKTAVAPLVEVRDRNNQPVAGAMVRFAVTRGRATLNGARTLTVATDAAGRAAVSGLVPGGAGSLQISATATFQGQTAAAVTIAQTNVMTAAEAAAVSGGAGGGGSGGSAGSGGGAAGGGGGLSTTTLALAGAAVAGGAVAATRVLGGGDDFEGPLNFQMTENFGSGTIGACSALYSHTGTFGMTLTIDGTNVSGKATWGGRRDFVSTTCSNLPAISTNNVSNWGWSQHDPAVGGSTSNITFHHEVSNRTDPQNFTCADCGQIHDFVGALNGDTITGTLDYSNLAFGRTQGRVLLPVTITKR